MPQQTKESPYGTTFLLCSSLSRRSSSMSVDGGADLAAGVALAFLRYFAAGKASPDEPAFVSLTRAVPHHAPQSKKVLHPEDLFTL